MNDGQTRPGFGVLQELRFDAPSLSLHARSGPDFLFVSARAADGSGLAFGASAQFVDERFTILPNTRLTVSAEADVTLDLDPACASGGCRSSYSFARLALAGDGRLAQVLHDGIGTPLQGRSRVPFELSFSTGGTATTTSLLLDMSVFAKTTCRKPRFGFL